MKEMEITHRVKLRPLRGEPRLGTVPQRALRVRASTDLTHRLKNYICTQAISISCHRRSLRDFEARPPSQFSDQMI